VWDTLVSAVNYLYDVDVAIASFQLASVKAIGDFFHHIWDTLYKVVIAKLILDYKKLHDWLAKLLGPLLKWIQRIRAWYFKHIFPIQHAILNVISTLRVILEVFRLLGAKWAAKLDADLAKIQSAVTTSIVDVVATLNKVSTILGLTIDPAMLIRPDAFGRSLWNALGQLKKAAGYGSARPVLASEHATEDTMRGAVTGKGSLINLQSDGTVVYDPALVIINGGLDSAAKSMGIGP
jgi:hypothetical protein